MFLHEDLHSPKSSEVNFPFSLALRSESDKTLQIPDVSPHALASMKGDQKDDHNYFTLIYSLMSSQGKSSGAVSSSPEPREMTSRRAKVEDS